MVDGFDDDGILDQGVQAPVVAVRLGRSFVRQHQVILIAFNAVGIGRGSRFRSATNALVRRMLGTHKGQKFEVGKSFVHGLNLLGSGHIGQRDVCAA